MATQRMARAGAFPPCFASAAQFRQWRETAKRVPPGESQYCADCTPAYQSEMIRLCRCAHPGTTFHLTADGFLEGVRPGCPLPKRKREGA